MGHFYFFVQCLLYFEFKTGRKMRNVLSILLVFYVAIAVQCESIKSKIESPDCGSNGKLCPEDTCCPVGDDGTEPTCCKSASSSTGWGCCSITNAVCCKNGLKCCYPGFQCTDGGKYCGKTIRPKHYLERWKTYIATTILHLTLSY